MNKQVINEINNTTGLTELKEIEEREDRKKKAAFRKLAEKHGFDSTDRKEKFIEKYGNDAEEKWEEFLELRRSIIKKYDYSGYFIAKKISLKPPSPRIAVDPHNEPYDVTYSNKTHGGKTNKSKRKTNKRKAKTVRRK